MVNLGLIPIKTFLFGKMGAILAFVKHHKAL